MGWGWFLAVDMQLFLVTPILIFIHHKSPKIGWFLLSVWLAQDVTTAVSLVLARDYSASILIQQGHFFSNFYQRTYVRASPYIVGIASGYIYSYLRRNKSNFSIPSILLSIGYFLAFTGMFVVVFAIYWVDSWNTFENSIYLGFSRLIWGLSIAYLIITMFLGYGGLLRSLFYARCWQPFAKLTYGAYLSHPIFMLAFYFNQWSYLFYQNINMLYFFIGHLSCAVMFSVVAYLLVEKPFMNLEPIIIKAAFKLIYKILRKPLPSKFYEHA